MYVISSRQGLEQQNQADHDQAAVNIDSEGTPVEAAELETIPKIRRFPA